MTPLQAIVHFYEGVTLRLSPDGRRVLIEFQPGKQSPKNQESIRQYVQGRETEIAEEMRKRGLK